MDVSSGLTLSILRLTAFSPQFEPFSESIRKISLNFQHLKACRHGHVPWRSQLVAGMADSSSGEHQFDWQTRGGANSKKWANQLKKKMLTIWAHTSQWMDPGGAYRLCELSYPWWRCTQICPSGFAELHCLEICQTITIRCIPICRKHAKQQYYMQAFYQKEYIQISALCQDQHFD